MTYEEQQQLANRHLEYFLGQDEYKVIPARILMAYIKWALFAQLGGHFMTATLKNDLHGAFAYADDEVVKVLHAIVKLLYNRMPSQCWRSQERINEWEGQLDWNPEY
jgi:hypothetical protein